MSAPAKDTDPAALEAEVKRDVKTLLESIDTDWMNDLDALFNRLLVLLDLIGFDYFFLLKKFDPGPARARLLLHPAIRGGGGSERARESCRISWRSFRTSTPTRTGTGCSACSRSTAASTWCPATRCGSPSSSSATCRRTASCSLIVRHAVQNPSWKPMVRTHRERIVEPYLAKVKAEAETTAKKVAHGRHTEKLEELARAVFGSGAVAKLSHYSEPSNPEYAQKMLGGFLYVSALELPARVPRGVPAEEHPRGRGPAHHQGEMVQQPAVPPDVGGLPPAPGRLREDRPFRHGPRGGRGAGAASEDHRPARRAGPQGARAAAHGAPAGQRRGAHDDRRLGSALRVDRPGAEARARGHRQAEPRLPGELEGAEARPRTRICVWSSRPSTRRSTTSSSSCRCTSRARRVYRAALLFADVLREDSQPQVPLPHVLGKVCARRR